MMHRIAWLLAAQLAAAPVWASGKTDQLVGILRADRNFKLRANAARLLGKDGSDGALTALLDALRDEHPVVRATACASLASFSGRRVRPALEKMQTDSDDSVRRAAAGALRLLVKLSANSASTGNNPSFSLRDIKPKGSRVADGRHLAFQESLRAELLAAGHGLGVDDGGERGYQLIGEVACEDRAAGKGAVFFCRAELVVVRMPGKVVLGSIGASGGAGLKGTGSDKDRQATQAALFKAVAKSLIEDTFGVVNQDRAQNGEEALQ